MDQNHLLKHLDYIGARLLDIEICKYDCAYLDLQDKQINLVENKKGVTKIVRENILDYNKLMKGKHEKRVKALYGAIKLAETYHPHIAISKNIYDLITKF